MARQPGISQSVSQAPKGLSTSLKQAECVLRWPADRSITERRAFQLNSSNGPPRRVHWESSKPGESHGVSTLKNSSRNHGREENPWAASSRRRGQNWKGTSLGSTRYVPA